MKLFESQNTKGFTLIELLIVIALLGALAIGLLAAIDPIEQIRRGRDTTLRDVASQFYNAEQRYYTNRGVYTTTVNGTGTTAITLTAVNTGGDITALLNAGELKSQFASQVTSGSPARGGLIYVSGDAATPTAITVCFRPESKSFTTDTVNNVYTSAGGACATPGTNVCYTCIR